MTSRTAIRIILAMGLISGAQGLRLHASEPPPLSVRMQKAAAPESRRQAWENRARVILKEWTPKVRTLLGDNANGSAPDFDFMLETGRMGKPAIVLREKGRKPVLKVSADWVTAHPEDKGVVIHELTHLLQDYPEPAKDFSKPKWLVEGIADWIRFFNFEKPVNIPAPTAGCHLNGYREAANFLDWANKRYPGLIRSLHKQLKGGTYSDNSFQELTGKSLEKLQLEHVKAVDKPKG